jgi:hypothetical protein
MHVGFYEGYGAVIRAGRNSVIGFLIANGLAD